MTYTSSQLATSQTTDMMRWSLLAFLLVAAVFAEDSNNRQGKLFLVTSTTSMTYTTTTSVLSTTTTCFAVTLATKACTKRRKRRMVLDIADTDDETMDKDVITRVVRNVAEPNEDSLQVDSGLNKAAEEGSSRKGKFFWYYMTTTSTSTSLSYTATNTVTLSGCTPTGLFTACG